MINNDWVGGGGGHRKDDTNSPGSDLSDIEGHAVDLVLGSDMTSHQFKVGFSFISKDCGGQI